MSNLIDDLVRGTRSNATHYWHIPSTPTVEIVHNWTEKEVTYQGFWIADSPTLIRYAIRTFAGEAKAETTGSTVCGPASDYPGTNTYPRIEESIYSGADTFDPITAVVTRTGEIDEFENGFTCLSGYYENETTKAFGQGTALKTVSSVDADIWGEFDEATPTTLSFNNRYNDYSGSWIVTGDGVTVTLSSPIEIDALFDAAIPETGTNSGTPTTINTGRNAETSTTADSYDLVRRASSYCFLATGLIPSKKYVIRGTIQRRSAIIGSDPGEWETADTVAEPFIAPTTWAVIGGTYEGETQPTISDLTPTTGLTDSEGWTYRLTSVSIEAAYPIQ